MDKKTEKHILNILRQGTITWHLRNEALKQCRKKFQEGYYKNGKEKWVYYYQCAKCKDWLRGSDQVEVDHIEEIGSFNKDFDEYIRKMYCDLKNLQVLCVPCHKRKTASFAKQNWKRKSKV